MTVVGVNTRDGAGAPDGFAASRERFESVLGFLDGAEAAGLCHAELEARLQADGREVVRQLLQDHLELRAEREQRLETVIGVAGKNYGTVEADHQRPLTTLFGDVTVRRNAYRRRDAANLYPADAWLNLPEEQYSHGLRRLGALEAARGSYDGAVEAIKRATGQQVGKRQVEALALRAAEDFEDFYATRVTPTDPTDTDEEVLIISADGKGIVMRPEALRAATAKAAAKDTKKLRGRLSKGEKRNRKRLAEVGAVYTITPSARTPTDIIRGDDQTATAIPGPVARSKWLTASVVDTAATVISTIFDQADRRDPDHQQTWVALVDGNNHQIRRINTEAKKRGVKVHIVCDFVHVLEYLWSAAWSFYKEGDPNAETWVHEKALAVLEGHSSQVAAAIRRTATCRNLPRAQRANADTCADYLLRKRRYLDYPLALRKGWPIATGVIEGACRHLVKDRMDLTGARWGLDGAEAILKLRALHTNGDFDEYWHYHLHQERHRIHETRYARGVIPPAA